MKIDRWIHQCIDRRVDRCIERYIVRAVLFVALFASVAMAPVSRAQNAPSSPAAKQASPAKSDATKAETNKGEDAQLDARLSAFLRTLYAWGPAYNLKIGSLKDSVMPGFYDVPITITYNGQVETGTLYASKDGKYLLRGDIFKTSEDPFAAERGAVNIKDSPSIGPAGAKVTIVEFSDFQCPHCRLAYQALKDLLPKYPQVRLVYKSFPIENIHPWAMTAAIGARCAYQSSPSAFWKMYDAIFDQQDVISAENVYDKLTQFATAAGLSADAFHACLSDPATKQAVEDDLQQGQKLDISSTPTIFINGRRIVGGDPAALDQIITFELQRK